MFCEVFFVSSQIYLNVIFYIFKTLKYWIGVQQVQSYLMGRKCLFSIGWLPFYWWYHNENNLGVDFLSHQPASHPIFSYWVG